MKKGKKMKKRWVFLTILFLAILLNACAGNNSASVVDLEGQTWTLVNLNGDDPLAGRHPTLEFEAGQVTGNTGCNHYGGSYQIDGDSIRFENLFSTEMACLDPEGIMQQEQTYLELLSAADRFERIDGTLTLSTFGGQTLVFTNQLDDINSAEPTLETETPTQTIEAVVPTVTSTPVFEPPVGFREYQDPAAGISLYLPESWAVTGVLPGQSAIFQSYAVDKYVGGEAFEPGDTKCDLNIRPEGERAEDLINQWRSDAMTTIVAEDEISLQAGLTGQRFILDSMGRATVFITEINHGVVLLTCFGDFTPVDEIAVTLKALE